MRLLVLLSLLGSTAGCFYTVEKVPITHRIRISAQPPEAVVSLEDAGGKRELGPAPQTVEATSTVSMRRFFWPAFLYPVVTGAVALFLGPPLLDAFNRRDDPSTVLPQLITFSAAAAATPSLLVRCFVELSKSNVPWGDESLLDLNFWTNEPTPASKELFEQSAYTKVAISGAAPGHAPRRLELPRPLVAGEHRLVLFPDAPRVIPSPPSAPAPTPMACGRDTDCRGDRICANGACVAP